MSFFHQFFESFLCVLVISSPPNLFPDPHNFVCLFLFFRTNVDQILLDVCSYTKAYWLTSNHTFRENCLCLSWHLRNVSSLTARGGIVTPAPFFWAEMFLPSSCASLLHAPAPTMNPCLLLPSCTQKIKCHCTHPPPLDFTVYILLHPQWSMSLGKVVCYMCSLMDGAFCMQSYSRLLGQLWVTQHL